MVKRMQHIGTFLHKEMGGSLRGMSLMCRRFVNSSSEKLFLKVYSKLLCKRAQRTYAQSRQLRVRVAQLLRSL
jgi:hypothetical protein